VSAAAPDQHWDPARYRKSGAFVPELGLPVVELLDPRPGERILDLGCGDGVLTRAIADLGADVVGLDRSVAQVAAARGLGLAVAVADGAALPVRQAFDAVFSNAALHWMRNPAAVIAGVRRALKPGGRFVGEMGGHGNIAAIASALVAALDRRRLGGAESLPWYFPTAEEYGALLERGGFAVRSIRLTPRPTPLPGDISDWIEMFAAGPLAAVPERDRPAFLGEIRDALAPSLRAADGSWTADYVRLRFATVKTG
jgi:SAM-dependent methyltransferase